MTGATDAAERARTLRDIRDALRSYETSELAGVAAHLAEAAEKLLDVSQRLSLPISEDWYTQERAAREMGWVDGGGRVQKAAFSRAMKEKGVPRADLSQTRIYYHREDLDKALREARR